VAPTLSKVRLLVSRSAGLQMKAATLRTAQRAMGRLEGRREQLLVATWAKFGGARRYARTLDRTLHGVQFARFASLVADPATHMLKNTFADMGLPSPTSLDTRQSRVVLFGNDLSSLHSDFEVDVELRGLPTILLNDGGCRIRSAAELERIREDIIAYFHKTFHCRRSYMRCSSQHQHCMRNMSVSAILPSFTWDIRQRST